MDKVIDGKAIAAEIRQQIAADVVTLKAKGVTPGLGVVLVGDDPASRVYVSMKEKACEQAGIFSDEHKLPAETTEAQLLALIDELNNDDRIDGILVQLPLPDHINESKILEAISPAKDADGFHPYNVGRLATGNPLFQPCTPYGVMKMLNANELPAARSNSTNTTNTMNPTNRIQDLKPYFLVSKIKLHLFQGFDIRCLVIGSPVNLFRYRAIHQVVDDLVGDDLFECLDILKIRIQPLLIRFGL